MCIYIYIDICVLCIYHTYLWYQWAPLGWIHCIYSMCPQKMHFWGCDLPNLSASHGGPSGLCWWPLLWTSLYPKMACASWQSQSSPWKEWRNFLSELSMESTLLFPIECHCVEICALHACQQNCTVFSVVCKPHVWYVWRTLVCDAWMAMRKWGLYVIIRWRPQSCGSFCCLHCSTNSTTPGIPFELLSRAPTQPTQPNCQITTRNLPKHNLRLGKRSSPKTNMSLAHTTLFLDIMGCPKWCCSKLVMDLHVFFSFFWEKARFCTPVSGCCL